MLVEPAEKSRRRGRPLGQAKVNREAGLRLHDLAFARAVVQGVSVGAAAERYLPELPGDERVAASYFRRLLGIGADVLVGMGELGAANVLKAWVEPQGAELTEAQAVAPTLDEFAEEVGAEDFSEREILEMYQERYGVQQTATTPTASRPAAAKVLDALSLIQSRGLVLPKPTDVLRLWFSAGLDRCLARAGIETLGSMVSFANHWGPHWYRRVPGIGKSRGARVLQWLKDHQSYLGEVHGLDLAAAAPADAAALVMPPDGLLRVTGPNALGAQTDREALNSWLATLDFVSPHTKRAYARDVGRLLVWAQDELGRGLSDLTVNDASAHARFLQSPSEKWITEPGRRRSLPITMRAGLAPSSTARALAAIGHFYGFLVETQYLRANPFARIRAPQDKGVQMDVQRCFSNAHLQAIQLTLAKMPESPRKRRWVAILTLLEGTGLRIGEIPVSWASVVDVADPEVGKISCLKVLGKGGRERLLPLKAEVLQALVAHRADQLVGDVSTPSPLIGLIDEPVHGKEEARGGALSTARVRVVLKDLFRLVADQVPGEMAEDFRRATPHFMRHTFAHRVLTVTKQDLAVTQQLLGHKSISTTGIYIKAGLAQRLSALSALQLRGAADTSAEPS